MIREDLVNAVHDSLGIDASRNQADEAVRAVLEAIAKGLRDDRTVRIPGFGTFSIVERDGRTGRNPRTGEPIEIPPATVVQFKPGKNLKEDL